MSSPTGQVRLGKDQITNFYHDSFVESQVKDFKSICFAALDRSRVVADMGGGCGFFSAAIQRELGLRVRVVDSDVASVRAAGEAGIEALLGDVLLWDPRGDESIACFNLILHHLVGANESETLNLQMKALERWSNSNTRIFVNEYIYDSYFKEVSGALIYWITASRTLSSIASLVARIVPSLRANTFGVGVRFRGENEWRRLFEAQGWRIEGYCRGREEDVSIARRLLLIRSCRRDSFLLAKPLKE